MGDDERKDEERRAYRDVKQQEGRTRVDPDAGPTTLPGSGAPPPAEVVSTSDLIVRRKFDEGRAFVGVSQAQGRTQVDADAVPATPRGKVATRAEPSPRKSRPRRGV